MSRSSRFCCQLAESLNNGRITPYKWAPGKPSGANRECVDVIGENGESVVLVEVELRRYGPVANVVKIWKWLDADVRLLKRKQIVIVQAFSAFYKHKPAFLRDNAEFLGRKLAKQSRGRLEYISMPFHYNPRKKRTTSSVTQGGGAMLNAAKKLAREISATLRKSKIATAV